MLVVKKAVLFSENKIWLGLMLPIVSLPFPDAKVV